MCCCRSQCISEVISVERMFNTWTIITTSSLTPVYFPGCNLSGTEPLTINRLILPRYTYTSEQPKQSKIMTDYPTPETPFHTVGLREICTVNNQHFKRLKGTTEWTEYTPRTPTTKQENQDEDDNIYLSLAHLTQTPSEPAHWALYIARENTPGHVFQVTGDAEYMVYDPSPAPVDITLSDDFSTLYQLAVLTGEQARVVEEVARVEMPPRARDRAAVRENCQGWCVRVVGRLVRMGIVDGQKVEMMRGMLEPV